jgi:signal peptidase II
MTFIKRWLLVLLLCGSSVGCDQATKRVAAATLASRPGYSWLGDSVRLGYAENEGAFLSLGASLSPQVRFWVFTVVVGAMLLGIALYLALGRRLNMPRVSGLALVLGGGGSNWFDRVMNDGRVVDFMNLGIGGLRTGVFNVADLAIVLGVALLVWQRREPRKASV